MTFAYPNSWTIEGEEISNGEFMGVRTLTLSSFGQPKRQGGVRKAGRQHERPNKKSEEVRDAEKKEDMLLKTVGEMKVENDFLKKSTASYTEKSLFSGRGIQRFVGDRPVRFARYQSY